MTDLAALRDRVQGLTGAISEADLHPKGWVVAAHDCFSTAKVRELIGALGGSLDAAERFHSAVLPGWWWTVGNCGLTSHASVGPDRAHIPEPDLSKYDDGFHADLTQPSLPAFALLVADLSALIAQQATVARGEGT